jgi:nucleotide-binding universal stress UspA family protein
MTPQMTPQTIHHIVCAIRGGPESRETVSSALDLARETDARLTLFHVVDAEFLGYTSIGPLSIAYHELLEMAKFALLILCNWAERCGVARVDYVLRQGNIRHELRQLTVETDAEAIVMGRPRRDSGHNVFRASEFKTFIAELDLGGDLRTIQVTPSDNEGQ